MWRRLVQFQWLLGCSGLSPSWASGLKECHVIKLCVSNYIQYSCIDSLSSSMITTLVVFPLISTRGTGGGSSVQTNSSGSSRAMLSSKTSKSMQDELTFGANVSISVKGPFWVAARTSANISSKLVKKLALIFWIYLHGQWQWWSGQFLQSCRHIQFLCPHSPWTCT